MATQAITAGGTAERIAMAAAASLAERLIGPDASTDDEEAACELAAEVRRVDPGALVLVVRDRRDERHHRLLRLAAKLAPRDPEGFALAMGRR